MIKLKCLLKENVDKLKQDIASLYKEYHKLLAQMYGSDGTETRMAVELVRHLGTQSTLQKPATLTSPEFDKARQENKDLMKKMGELGSKMRALYQQLEDAGESTLVKQMRDYQAKETEKFVLKVADEAEQKVIDDSKNNITKLRVDQQKAVDDLEKEMKSNSEKYQADYRKWLQGPQDTPPPHPPTLSTKK